MLSEAQSFWDAISGKIKQLIGSETQNAFRAERYEVSTAPNGSVVGVRKPFGSNELLLPYSTEVAGATVGDPVLVVWWGGMSNAKVYYMADGFAGSAGGGGGGGSAVTAGTISLSATWSGSGPYTQAVVVTGATVTANSKVDIQPDATAIQQMLDDGVNAIFVENNAGTLTAYAVGAATTVALTIQCTVTEVS